MRWNRSAVFQRPWRGRLFRRRQRNPRLLYADSPDAHRCHRKRRCMGERSMNGIRVMPGIIDMTGRTVNSLKVGPLVARHPRPRYEVICDRCGTRSTASQDQLTSGAARCRAGGCGKPVRSRERVGSDEQLAAREAERIAQELEVSERRMAAETDGWERPTRYKPTPDPYQPLSERQRLELRSLKEQEEQERREAERPRLEAERRANEEQTAREAAEQARKERERAYWADWVMSDSPDPKLYVSEPMRSASMPPKEAEAFTAKAAAEFAESPEYAPYRTVENADLILGYLRRNRINIADLATIRAAFVRLRDLGLLKQKPAPAPQSQPVELPRQINLAVQRQSTNAPKTYKGRDYATGREREFTQREVDRMSSLEFQRAFQVVPTVGALFNAMAESRS